MKKSKSKAKPNYPNTRKVLRKQKRIEKKVKKQTHYLNKKNIPKISDFTPGKFVKRPVESEKDVDIPKKKQKLQPTNVHDLINKERLKEMKEADRLKADMEEQRRQLLLKANEDEDKVIKKLEKQLGLNKTKKKNSYFADDGLDYLLELCDKATSEQIVAAEKHLATVEDESDFEEDLAEVTGKDIQNNKKEKKLKKQNKLEKDTSASDDQNADSDDASGDDDDSNSELDSGSDLDDEKLSDEEDEDISEEFDDSDIDNENENVGKKPNVKEKQQTKSKAKETKRNIEPLEDFSEDEALENPFSDDEVSHLSGDDDLSNDEDEPKKEVAEKPDVWEDIYGRKRDKEGNVIKEEKGSYIPPHLRNKEATSDKDLTQLKRQIKSVLNKLAGTNLHWACNQIEVLYSSNSRHSVNSTLTSLWSEAVLSFSSTPDRLIVEHTALLAVLHANVGQEIGAHFLQEFTKMFDEMMQTPQPVENKTLDNLIACLAQMYSFKIYHATLLYDILHRLLITLTEKNIECILVALRCVGGVLRKEEPLALKNFIHEAQVKVQEMNENAATGSRIKFLLDVLMAVKNNNLTKIPNYDPTYSEQLKKQIRSIVRKGNYATPLNIRLDDLLKADERGKWWVVGSAWEGNIVKPEEKEKKSSQNFDQKLLELARKQRMNTDVRRSIFCVIMSAEDYMDAFEKLQHLGLKGQQDREVIHVLLACCLQEKTYNPYYAVLGLKYCDTDRKYQLGFQFAVWDKMKELDQLSKTGLKNLAQFLTHLILEKGLALSVLKVIEFSDLNKITVKFMRQILLAIIMNEDLQKSIEAFQRIAKSPKLHMFRESLRLFIQHFLMKNAGKQTSVLSEQEMEVLKERTIEVNRILSMYESKLKL